MWQILLTAAVAGSGFFAKRFFFNPNPDPTIILSQETHTECDHSEEHHHHFATPSNPQVSNPRALHPCNAHNFPESESQSSTAHVDGDELIFRFSSSGSRSGSGSRFGTKNVVKKSGNGCGGNRGNVGGFKKIGIGKVEKKCRVLDQSKGGRKFAVCVKKRRTSKNSSGKCESCSSKGNSFFSWGLGVGIMYMMSAGKAEISRLNTSMDETAKVVQELKSELSKRKSLRTLQVSSSITEITTNPEKNEGTNTQPVSQSSTENRDYVQDSALLVTEEGECGSSVLTEEPQQGILDMDRLEAELEYELQKLPLCSTEASGVEGRISDICEIDASTEGFDRPDGQNWNSNQFNGVLPSELDQFNGVLPSELDQKLCHVLIERQESQIVDLESELHQAQSKLHEKEAELQALKDCVRRLTEFSLATATDEESEAQVQEEMEKDGDWDKKMGPPQSEPHRSVVGMKRVMDFESHSCHI